MTEDLQLFWREARAVYLDAEAAALDALLSELANVEALSEEAGDTSYLEAMRPLAALTRERVTERRTMARALRTRENDS